MRTKRTTAVLIICIILFALIWLAPFAENTNFESNIGDVCWRGAMNLNDANNYVTDKALPLTSDMTEMKWSYPLNTTMDNWGAYYAGTQVVADGYLYATGGGKLHRINTETGVGSVISEPGITVGTYGNYYDYLCYADGVLLVATQTKIEAYSLDGRCLGAVNGAFGYYHPVQYKDGYVICNGYIYRLEKDQESIEFNQIGEDTIGGDIFNWNSGVFANGLFYTASKTTVYAVEYRTNTVVDKFVFDQNRTASMNVQPGVSYDAETERLYWGTYSYDTSVHSIKIDVEEGENKGRFDKSEGSYIQGDAGQKSVCTPIIFNGRVYLAGQQGEISVLDAYDLSEVYTNTKLEGCGKVQSNAMLSVYDGEVRLYVQGYNGCVYVFTDMGNCGKAEKLAETKNYMGVKYPNSYEQFAIDDNGKIYCYNESGYLFCFAPANCEVPQIITDLSTETVKLEKNSDNVEPLEITAYIPETLGELSYQWQVSEDKINWSDVENTNSSSFVPPTTEEGTFYYRCIAINTSDTGKAQTFSNFASILVKTFSNNTDINVLVNANNSLGTSTNSSNSFMADELSDNTILIENCSLSSVKNIWIGSVEENTVTSFKIIQGLDAGKEQPSFTKKTSSNSYQNIIYNGYYRSNFYKLPIVAKVEVTAEDGITNDTHYIVIDSGLAAKYTIGVTGFVGNNEFYDESTNKISFTDANQSVVLTPETESIGTGESDNPLWTWSSSDTAVANVDSVSGLVTCVGGGTATITATYQQIEYMCEVESGASVHNVHSYVDGICSACGAKMPSGVTAEFTIIDKNNKPALSKDGKTEIYNLEISVDDADSDGAVTLNDAFLAVHELHSQNGKEDFATENSDYGLFITKLWGEETSNTAYMVNDNFASSLTTPLAKNDYVKAYFYRDTTAWSDIYTCIDGADKISTDTDTVYSVHGVGFSGEIIPNGATVKVYKSGGEEVTDMACKVNSEGEFSLNFKETGNYTIEVSGTASYSCKVWDYASNGYINKMFENSPVVLSRLDITVFPYIQKTVYVTIATKSGEFAINKDGDEMWRFPITASDNLSEPDGEVTIAEVLATAHRQYHPDGISAFSDTGFITKLWGEENNGNCSYYFNDVFMTGSGTKTGSNGRAWEDKLLNTAVEDGDALKIYSFQASNWENCDLYTYFSPVSESAVLGNAKTFTLKKGESNGSNTLETSLVKVYNENKQEITELASTVGEGGTFSITFGETGTYFIDVRTNGTNYITPSRIIVHVNKGISDGVPAADGKVYISVKGSKGKVFLNKTAYTMKAGETAYSLLKRTGLAVDASSESQFGGVYVEAIEGLGEFDEGSTSGWMYCVNGEFPKYSPSLYVLSEGDYVEWKYTSELGDVVDDSYVSGATQSSEKKEETSNTPNKSAVLIKSSVSNDTVTVESVTVPKAAAESKSNTILVLDVSEKSKSATNVAISVKAFSNILNAVNANNKIDGVEIKLGGSAVTIDRTALVEIGNQSANERIVIGAERVPHTRLSNKQQNGINGIKNAEIVSLGINAGRKNICDFGKGCVSVTVPYEKTVSDDENVAVWYINEDGSLTKLEATYDKANKSVSFKTTHFSYYLIGTERHNLTSFADVPQQHWAYPYITDLAERGILKGKDSGFAPNDSITRAEFVVVISRISGEELPETADVFCDVSKDDWYAQNVTWAVNAGITSGIEPDKFAPEQKITRQDMAVMLLRYLDSVNGTLKTTKEFASFEDEDDISGYAQKAVRILQKAGIVSGTLNGRFLPKQNATRAETAKMLSVFLDVMEEVNND